MAINRSRMNSVVLKDGDKVYLNTGLTAYIESATGVLTLTDGVTGSKTLAELVTTADPISDATEHAIVRAASATTIEDSGILIADTTYDMTMPSGATLYLNGGSAIYIDVSSSELRFTDGVTGSLKLSELATSSALTTHTGDASIHAEHPETSTDNAVARFDSTAGALKDSAVTIADTTGDMAGVGTLGCGAITSSGAISAAGSVTSIVTSDGTLADDATLDTGIGAIMGLLVVRDLTNSKTGIWRIDGQNHAMVTANEEFSSVQGTDTNINLYWNSTQWTVENKSGSQISVTVGQYI